MPRPRKPPRVIRCKDRPGLFAYISRAEPHIALNTEDESEAQSKLATLLVARRLREVDPGDRPIAEVFEEHFKRSKTNHTQKTNYEQGRNGLRLLRWLEERTITSSRQVTKELVEDYKTSRRFARQRKRDGAAGVSAARINAELTTWAQVMRIAVEWGLVGLHVLQFFVKLREPRPEPHRVGLTKADIERFLRAEKDAGYRALWRTVIGTGMRDEEVRHMDASDIRTKAIVVTPKEGWATKGYRYRTIPASPKTVKAARDFLAARDKLKLEKKTVWKRVQKTRKAAEITKHFSLHDLRRAWASHMLAAGHKVEMISKWLGHADLITTMRYLRIVTDEVVDVTKLPF